TAIPRGLDRPLESRSGSVQESTEPGVLAAPAAALAANVRAAYAPRMVRPPRRNRRVLRAGTGVRGSAGAPAHGGAQRLRSYRRCALPGARAAFFAHAEHATAHRRIVARSCRDRSRVERALRRKHSG